MHGCLSTARTEDDLICRCLLLGNLLPRVVIFAEAARHELFSERVYDALVTRRPHSYSIPDFAVMSILSPFPLRKHAEFVSFAFHQPCAVHRLEDVECVLLSGTDRMSHVLGSDFWAEYDQHMFRFSIVQESIRPDSRFSLPFLFDTENKRFWLPIEGHPGDITQRRRGGALERPTPGCMLEHKGRLGHFEWRLDIGYMCVMHYALNRGMPF